MMRYLACAVVAFTLGCGSKKGPCDPVAQTGCDTGKFCEVVQNGTPTCYGPVLVRGTVSDPTTMPATKLPEARVVALDTSRSPVSSVATSAGDGTYELK